MKAAVFRSYGPPEVLRIEDVEKPVPADDQVLVRVAAATVCAADRRIRAADPWLVRIVFGVIGPRKLRVLGMELSGTVEQVGKSVTRFRPGDHVFGGTVKFGTHAEYACAAEDGLEIKPDSLTFEQAAAFFFGGLSALTFLRKAGIQAGQNVLIYGASGSVGVFAVQLAKHFGARVTGVCSTANLDWVKSLGADQVVDYTREDFSKAGHVYDIVFDTVGKAGVRRSMAALKPGGTLIPIAPAETAATFIGDMVRHAWIQISRQAKVVGAIQRSAPGSMAYLKDLIERGRLRTVIDRCYRLDEIAEAHRYAQAGHKKGHVVVVVDRATR